MAYKNIEDRREYERRYYRTHFQAISSRRRKNRPKYKLARESYRLEINFGISLNDKRQMYEKQKGLCAVCEKPLPTEFTKAQVDHNHLTGQVRELLCRTCNVLVGWLEHEHYEKAKIYLRKHNMSWNRRDSKDPMPGADNSQRRGGGNEPYPSGAESHGDGQAEHVTKDQNRSTGSTAMAVPQPTRQKGDGNVPAVGESHNQSKAERVPESARW